MNSKLYECYVKTGVDIGENNINIIEDPNNDKNVRKRCDSCPRLNDEAFLKVKYHLRFNKKEIK